MTKVHQKSNTKPGNKSSKPGEKSKRSGEGAEGSNKPKANSFLTQFVKSDEIIAGNVNQDKAKVPKEANEVKETKAVKEPKETKEVKQAKVVKEDKPKQKAAKQEPKQEEPKRKASGASIKSKTEEKDKKADKVAKKVKKAENKPRKESAALSDVAEDNGMETLFGKRESMKPHKADQRKKSTEEAPLKKVKTDTASDAKPKKVHKPPVDNTPSYEAYISSLPTEATAEIVYKHFSNCGPIKDVKLKYAADGTPKKKGFIKFGTEQARDNALKLTKSLMVNKRISVEKVFDSLVQKPEGEFKPPSNPNTKEGRSIIVRNLPFTFNEDDMYKMFISCGEIMKHRVIRNETGQSRGFGFVDFTENDFAREAVAKSGTKVEGRPIYVEFTAPKENLDRPDNGDKRGFGGNQHRVNDNRYINENRRGYMAKSFGGEIVDL